ncbi:unnamed protein product [Alopecurus aequalis]
MAKMWQPKPLLLLVAVSLGALACTVAGGKPLVTAISKDPSTLLYGFSVPVMEHGGPTNQIVLDLSGPLTWTICPPEHVRLECTSVACMQAHRFAPTNFPHTGNGKPDGEHCKCTAHPHNPVSGETPSGDMTHVTSYANTTDGKNPLYVVPVELTTSCAPVSLLSSLPAGAIGVAGLARSDLALSAQVAKTQKVENIFALCLPFVEMKGEDKQAGYGSGGGTEAPAMVIGGFQMEHNLLVFDEENQRLGFSSLLLFRQTTCNNFNFTMAA